MTQASKSPTRRDALRFVGSLGAAAILVNCDDASTTNAGGAGGASGSTTGATTATGTTTATTGSTVASTSTGSTGSWATGGTSVLQGKDYGNPFESGVGPTCTVYKSSTKGPCHAPSPERKDVSEGYPGLPMRLELLVVDANCDPVPNASVEIWACDTHGVYSGDIDGNNDAFCTGGDTEAAAASWFRGIQTAGADGRVTFDANFPGWYGGRATHIHFTIRVGSQEYLTSQIFFDEALKEDIYNTQPEYEKTSGQGYQPNAGDMVLSESGLSLAEATCQTAKQSDGAMLAWKAITISA